MSELELEERPKKQRSKAARNGFVFLFNLAISGFFLTAVLVGIGLYVGKQQFDAVGPLTKQQTVTINKGAGLASISSLLQRAGIVEQSYVFNFGVRAYRNTNNLKAGEYQFEPGESMKSVMDKIVSGKSLQYFVTIPEGWTTRQVYQRVAANEILTGDMPSMRDEGTLLPNTYSFQRGDTRASVIERMATDHVKLIDKLWAERTPSDHIPTKQALVILASLIEKETGPREEERGKVAQVFYNRMQQGWRLETDPTILYGLYEARNLVRDREGGITKSEKNDRSNTYNTYFIEGLPPGPITNPGEKALQAAANPTPTDAMFFVADGKGGHVFTKTLEEHSKYVSELRQREAEQAAAAAKEEAAKAATDTTQSN